MAQFQRMDACLDTLSTELYQVNIHVSCIAWQKAIMGGFAPEASPPPPLVASDSDSDSDSENKDDSDDDDAFDDND